MSILDTLEKPKAKKKDLKTSEGLVDLARERGVDITPPKRKTGFLGGLQRFAEMLSTGEFAVGGLLAGKGVTAGIREKISPSDVILGEGDPEATRGAKILRGALGLAIDVALDPTTYLTLGAGSAIKATTKAGVSVLLSKTGKEMLKDLAQEVGEKAARQQVAEAALIKGNERLLAKQGLKWAGFELIPQATLKKPFKFIEEGLKKTHTGRELLGGLEKTGKAVAKLFNRDYGLDEVAKKNKQRLLDGIEGARTDAAEQIGIIFAGTTKVQREAISLAIEGGKQGIQRLEGPLQKLAQRTKDIFAGLHKEEERLGLIDSWIPDYATHLYRNRERADEFLHAYKVYRIEGKPSAYLRFARERRIPTITEAEKLGLEPVKDIAEILNVRMMASEKAKLMQKFFYETAETKGVKGFAVKGAKEAAEAVPQTLPRNIMELQENYTRLGDVAVGVPKEISNVMIPAHIGKDISGMYKKLFNQEELNFLLKGYDKALNFFKGSVTVLFPAFHGRNAVSNVMQNFLDIGVQAINPARHKEAVDIMTKQTGEIITDLGTKIAYKEIRALAKKHGVLNNRVTTVDIDRTLTENVFQRNTPVEIGRKIGRAIEGEARMVNFVTNLRRGFDPEDAATKVKEFIFDYDNLSIFEKDVLRRLIPFYTWQRKNIALQLKASATVPGKQIAQFKALRAMEEMFGESKDEDEKKYAPDFVLSGMNILLNRKNDDRTFLVGFDLPIESAFDFLNKPLKEVMSSLSPFLKVPLEFASGYNYFKEKKIKEDDSGRSFEAYPQFFKDWLEYSEKKVVQKNGKSFTIQKVNPNKKWWLQQIENFAGVGRFTSQGFLEPIQSGYKLVSGDKVTVEDKWNFIRFFTGLRAFTIDIESSKRAQEKGEVRELIDILERKGILGKMEIAFPAKEPEERSSRIRDLVR